MSNIITTLDFNFRFQEKIPDIVTILDFNFKFQEKNSRYHKYLGFQ